MADDVQLDLNTTSGAVVRTVQKSSVQYPVSILDVGTHPSDNTGQPRLVSKGNNIGMPVEGLADNGDAIQGSPILIGAKYDSAPAAVDDGDMSVLVSDSNHNLRTTIYGDGTENGISISSTGAISVDALTKIDFDTTALGEADQACVGIVVPSATGPTAIQSSSIQDTVSSVVQPSVSGLNVSQLGAFFFDGDNNDSADTTNVAAFGIAIASADGPKAIGSDGSTTTYLPIEGTVTANLGTTDTANLAAIKTAVETIDNAISGSEMQVDIVSGSVGITGTTQSDITAIKTAVELIDNAISGSEMQVDIVSGSVGITGTTQADITAIKTAVETIDNAISGSEMQVDIVSGSVDLTGTASTDLAAIKTAVQLIDNAISGSEMQVDIVSGSVGITGTTQADITAIKTAVETIDNAVSGSEMQVDVVGSLPAGSNAIGKLAANSGVDIGDVDVTSISAGTNAIGDVGLVGRSNTGLATAQSIDVDENKLNLGLGDTTIYSITAFNTTSSPIYLKFWDEAVGSVTVGTTVPKLTFLIPANASGNGAGFVFSVPQGIFFTNQVVWAATTGVEATSSTGPDTNGCIVNFFYKQ